MVFWPFVDVICFVAKTKTFGELLILRMSSFNSRWNESFTCLNFNDVTMSDKSFSKGIRSEQGGGHVDLESKVSLISLSHFCWFK